MIEIVSSVHFPQRLNKFIAVLILAIFFFPLFSFAQDENPIEYPVVIVPGMLASFNKKLMYQDKEGGEWKFVTGGNYYKDLIQQLKNNGYEEGKTLFIAFYDWRKPVSETARNYLKPKIDEAKQKSGKEKADIVAHSMGGLLSRSYIQSDEYHNDVNQLIMLGTPNKGAGGAYLAWEGGEYPEEWGIGVRFLVWDIERALRKTRKLKEIERPLAFRTFFPSLRDLLPVYGFAKKDNQTKSSLNLTEKNNFLAELNGKNQLLDRVTVTNISGTELDTLDNVYLSGEARSEDDQKHERWRDNKPVASDPYVKTVKGDKTVLARSATLNGSTVTNFKTETVAHVDLPNYAGEFVSFVLNPGPPPVLSKRIKEKITLSLLKIFSSVRIGNAVAVAQNEDDEAEDNAMLLDQASEGFVPHREPDSVLSFTASANIKIVIKSPDGKTLSASQNDFGDDADFDDDPDDPEDIKLITVFNPPAGKYTVEIEAEREGEYYLDSGFNGANTEDEETQEGALKTGEKKIWEINLDENGITNVVVPPVPSVTPVPIPERNSGSGSSSSESRPFSISPRVAGASTLSLSRLADNLYNRLRTMKMNKKHAQFLLPPVSEMRVRLLQYDMLRKNSKTKKQAEVYLKKARQDFGDFSHKLDQLIKEGSLSQKTINVLNVYRQKLIEAGM